MPLSLEKIRTPKPAETVIIWEDEELHITYDRNAFTADMYERIYTTPIRERLTQVLLYWDLLKDGQPWVPNGRDDPCWTEKVYELRALRAATTKGEPLTDEEYAMTRATLPSIDERLAAYRAAWDAILAQLPRDFVKAVDGGILDDFLGVSWRGRISANGSAPAASTGDGRGGTTTPAE